MLDQKPATFKPGVRVILYGDNVTEEAMGAVGTVLSLEEFARINPIGARMAEGNPHVNIVLLDAERQHGRISFMEDRNLELWGDPGCPGCVLGLPNHASPCPLVPRPWVYWLTSEGDIDSKVFGREREARDFMADLRLNGVRSPELHWGN